MKEDISVKWLKLKIMTFEDNTSCSFVERALRDYFKE